MTPAPIPLPQLPCGHAYCRACLGELRTKGVDQACPLCRTELPPGLDGLFDLGSRVYQRVGARCDRGLLSWPALLAAQQVEMEEAVSVLTEAADQGHLMAANMLGELYSGDIGMAADLPNHQAS